MIHGIRHVLLDIEGTTCPVSFVSEVLFPYAHRQVGEYLEQHGKEAEIQPLLEELRQAWEREEDAEARALLQGAPSSSETTSSPTRSGQTASETTLSAQMLLPYLHWLIRRDRKLTPWKELQGLIWHEGYARGDLRADLFSDVVPMLRHWKQMGMELSVYSSGSVAAQKLLYGHSQEGDLQELFSHWFDTRIGLKQEAESYRRILEPLGCQAGQVVFVSDAISELQAASAAGMQVVFSDREGNPQRDPGPFTSISRLDQLTLSL